jgi:hypothetical protein
VALLALPNAPPPHHGRATVKRSGPLQRKTRLKSSGKPIAKQGPAKAKKEARYQAYLRSPEWREKKRLVRERSKGRCENDVPKFWVDQVELMRCSNPAQECHHLTYARFTEENLDDLLDVCRPCHERLESEQRPWNRNRNRKAS